jgi:hypothetical protein
MGSDSGPLPRRHCGKGQRRSRALSIDPFYVLTVDSGSPVRPLCKWTMLWRSPGPVRRPPGFIGPVALLPLLLFSRNHRATNKRRCSPPVVILVISARTSLSPASSSRRRNYASASVSVKRTEQSYVWLEGQRRHDSWLQSSATGNRASVVPRRLRTTEIFRVY